MSTRATFLTTGAALLVVAGADGPRGFALAADAPAPAKLTGLGDWLRMRPDGIVEFHTDKVEMGMGTPTGLAQFVADDLDVPFERVVLVLGDTADTMATGGVGGSNSTILGNFAVRNAAAEMRRLLVTAAAQRLGVDPAQTTVVAGVVRVTADPSKQLRYTDVLAALTPDPQFPLKGDGFTATADVPAVPKAWTSYTVAGAALPRRDAAPKAFGRYPYVVNVKRPGMLHGRFVYPPHIGASVLAVDETSIAGIGDARVVRIKDFVGVVAGREWDAIRAVRTLAVRWTPPAVTLPTRAGLGAYMWAQEPFKSATVDGGNLDATLGTPTLTSEYVWPFQSHANMGPGCVVAEVHGNDVTIWSGTQKTHALRNGIAKLLQVPLEGVHVVWVSDAGSYGRSGIDEPAAAAALLARATGRPVRVQSMRADNTQWSAKAPAIAGRMRARVENGTIVAFDARLRQFNGNEIFSQPSAPGTFLAAQLAGVPNELTFEFAQYGRSTALYAIPNYRSTAELLTPFAPAVSSMRTAHMRDPEGPGTTFIVESFIDELAAQAGADPIAFRIAHLTNPRHIAALTRVARESGWQTRPAASVKRTAPNGERIGTGVAFAVRGETIVATVAEVGVTPSTGAVRVRRIVCAHDCGFIVNPASLQGTIEANLIQSISRSLFEEATFDAHGATSHDWVTYPVAHMRDVPDEVKVVMIRNQAIPPAGAGEPSSRPTAAAIANAIYDATGVRMRTAPFTPAYVLAAMHSV